MNTDFFYKTLQDVKSYGRKATSRGLETLEILDYKYNLPPYARFMCFDHRKLKLDYIKQEFMWYLLGEPKDVSICRLASMWKGLINEDGTINSNYGYYIFNPKTGIDGVSNFDRVVNTLTQDPQSRRAVMMILNSEHLNSETKDYPCTVYINYLIRDGKLHQFVRMRSQDAIFGMGNDAPFFSMLMELMYWTLVRGGMNDLQLGTYHHSADSFHVYEKHYKMLDQILADPVVSDDFHERCPVMSPLTPISLKLLRDNRQWSMDELKKLSGDVFTAWLLERDDEATLVMPEVA